ncbi:hypothetical protein LMG26411_06777 [Cupriavidus numazuensis]|uniref:Uncharacterized protein n=1 Tax=Cupriavidus numazuensis TaxID=221992 RepID=A0ABM8TSZ7_9BURK|nr:hypothetical protein LMG26411_06777 [Cupriavidus numazuensis]
MQGHRLVALDGAQIPHNLAFPVGFHHALLKGFPEGFVTGFRGPVEFLCKCGAAGSKYPWNGSCARPGQQKCHSTAPARFSIGRSRRGGHYFAAFGPAGLSILLIVVPASSISRNLRYSGLLNARADCLRLIFGVFLM